MLLSLFGAAVVVGAFGAYWRRLPLAIYSSAGRAPIGSACSPLELVLLAVAAPARRLRH